MTDAEKKEYLKAFGERICQLRTERNMSQDELARKCGYISDNARSSIQKIEAGRNDPPASKIQAIANALEVSLDALLENLPNASDSATFSKQSAIYDDVKEVFGDPACEMLKKFSRLDSVDQGKIIERTDMLLENEKYSVKESCG
jgi:repressor LexA